MPAPLVTQSERFISRQAARYGTLDYQNWQALRGVWYSLVQYNAAAGQPVLNFFGASLGTVNNEQLTNLPDSNSLGVVNFQLKAVRCAFFIAETDVTSFDGTDASTFYSEIVNGLFQSGVLEILVGDRVQTQIPLPFLYAPPADGRPMVKTAGLTGLTLVEGAPNTFSSVVSAAPHAELLSRMGCAWLLDPNKFIAALQNFTARISWPSGSLPAIATGIINDDTNPLYIGVIFDGITFRPQA